MKKITMTRKIGGFRDGVAWPDAGETVLVSDVEGERLVQAGYGVETDDDDIEPVDGFALANEEARAAAELAEIEAAIQAEIDAELAAAAEKVAKAEAAAIAKAEAAELKQAQKEAAAAEKAAKG